MRPLHLYPVGHVHNGRIKPAPPESFKETESMILLEGMAPETLDGLEPGMDLVVLFWFDRRQGFYPKVHPKGDPHRPLKGVFATCAPQRPNPIGVTRCVLLERGETWLRVKGLDALDGTPVLDIKPFAMGAERL